MEGACGSWELGRLGGLRERAGVDGMVERAGVDGRVERAGVDGMDERSWGSMVLGCSDDK